MRSDRIERAMDQARTARARHLLALCALCLGFLAGRIGGARSLHARDVGPARPVAGS